jgi:hypothetical protein
MTCAAAGLPNIWGGPAFADMNLVAGHLFPTAMTTRPEDMVTIASSYLGVARVEVKPTSATGMRCIFPSPRPARGDPDMPIELKAVFERRQNLYKNTRSTKNLCPPFPRHHARTTTSRAFCTFCDTVYRTGLAANKLSLISLLTCILS